MPGALRRIGLTLVALAANAGLGASALAQETAIRVDIIGTIVQHESVAREVAGPVPNTPLELDQWATDALESILDNYRSLGYSAARGWIQRNENAVTIEIDEGTMHRVVFVGANTLERITFSDNLSLPSGILHEPTLQSSLESLQESQGLRSATYLVDEEDEFVPTRLGRLVPERILYVYVVTEEELGLSVDIGVDSTWGFLTGLEYDVGDLIAPEDHFHGFLGLAFPLQEYVFEQEPKLRWLYGEIGADHRFATIGESSISPSVEVVTSLANYVRLDLSILESLVLRSAALGGLRFDDGGSLQYSLGLGVEGFHVASVDFVAGSTLAEPDGVFRPIAVAGLGIAVDDGTLRTDLRDGLELIGSIGANDRNRLNWRLDLTGRVVASFGRDHAMVAVRGIYVGGDARFYDEAPLAGDFQRTYFEDIYWVRQAAQLELAYRFGITHNFKIGVFHDASVFGDRTRSDADPALANSFGPSIHLLLLDQFAFDVHYGFGFSPSGFSHNMTLDLGTVY